MNRSNDKLTVIYDGACPMCCQTVHRLRSLDWWRRLSFVDGTNAQLRNAAAPGLTEKEILTEM
jgi:predicted DCC family thiol-disulfide oxidoreductase YuxK